VRLLFVLALLGLSLTTAACRGDTVGAPPADGAPDVADETNVGDALGDGSVGDTSLGDSGVGDGGVGDGGVGDGVPETVPTDGALDLGAYDAVFDGGCTSSSTNLVPSFESLSGWGVTGFSPTIIDGPCGKGLHLQGTAKYADIRHRFFGSWPSGTVVHMHAWFHANGVLGGTPPGVTAMFGHKVDGGEVLGKEVGIDANLQPKWVWMEATTTLDANETFFDVLVSSVRSDGVFDDFYLAGLAVYVDP